MKHGISIRNSGVLRRAVCCGAVAAAAGAPAWAGELRVGTEYIYPTEFTIQGGQVGPGGVITQPYVVPGGFQTRVVGVVFSVEATVADLSGGNIALASLEQKRTYGNTDLMLAATSGDSAGVARYLSRGAMVNARNSYGSTALMGASAGGSEDIVKLLLQRGAQANNKSDNGSTALMFAARNNQTAVARMLIEAGANVNEANRDGLTPLMFAVNGGYADMVELLLKNGAKTDVQDRHGTTPLTLATVKADDSIVVLLTRPDEKR
jgi:ankyrin repeat protein